MTVATDIQSARGPRRRLILKIDGHEPAILDGPRADPADMYLGVTNLPDGAASPLAVYQPDGTSEALNDRTSNGIDLSLDAGALENYVKEDDLVGLTFAGNTRLEAANPASLQITGAITYEILLRMTVVDSTVQNLFSVDNGGSEGSADNFLWSLRLIGGQFETLIEYGSGTNESHTWTNYPPNTTDIVHIAITRDAAGTDYNLYITGKLVQNITFSNAPTGGGSSDLHIGGDPNSVTGPYWSNMIWFGSRITGEEWSAAQVLQAYERGPFWLHAKHCLIGAIQTGNGINLDEMLAEAQNVELQLLDIPDSDGKSYWGKLLGAPARWEQSMHLRIAAGTAPNQQVDPNATTIPAKDVTGWNTIGVAHIGQEVFWYTGVSGTDLTGVTKGLYPCVGSGQFGKAYRRPEPGRGHQLPIGQYPYSWAGRRMSLSVFTYDDEAGRWQDPGDAELLWCGRITDEVAYEQENQDRAYWRLSGEDILSDLDRRICVNMPESGLAGINLLGPHSCSFYVRVHGFEFTLQPGQTTIPDTLNCFCEVVIASWYANIEALAKDINDQLQDSANWYDPDGTNPSTNRDTVITCVVDKNRAKFTCRPGGSNKKRLVDIHSPTAGNTYGFNHTLAALGFDPHGVRFTMEEPQSGQPQFGQAISGAPFETYTPLHINSNGGRIYVYDAAQFWADQGDDDSAQANIKIENAQLTDYRGGRKGTYHARYTARDTGSDYLTLDYVHSPTVLDSAFAGQRLNEPSTQVRQCLIPRRATSSFSIRGPYELLLYMLLSTGEQGGYNHATYDKLPLAASIGMQSDLVDVDSFLAADEAVKHSDLAARRFYPIEEGIRFSELLQRENKLFGWVCCWRRGKLTMRPVLNPQPETYDVQLDESNSASRADWPTVAQSLMAVVNQYECRVHWDRESEEWGPTVTIDDVDSIEGLGATKKVEIEHPGISWTGQSSAPRLLLEEVFLGRLLRYPSPTLDRTLAPKLLRRIYAGDMVRLVSTKIHDPGGSGDRNTTVFATVLNVQWDMTEKTGVATLMLHPLLAAYADPWCGSALVDKSAANSGWDSTNKRLTLSALQWGESGDSDDGARLLSGYSVLIIERAPIDPTSPQSWGPFTLDSDYETDGAELLTLPAGTTLTGWDTAKEYVVVFGDWTDASTAQQADGTWQADEDSELLDSGSGNDNAQHYG